MFTDGNWSWKEKLLQQDAYRVKFFFGKKTRSKKNTYSIPIKTHELQNCSCLKLRQFSPFVDFYFFARNVTLTVEISSFLPLVSAHVLTGTSRQRGEEQQQQHSFLQNVGIIAQARLLKIKTVQKVTCLPVNSLLFRNAFQSSQLLSCTRIGRSGPAADILGAAADISAALFYAQFCSINGLFTAKFVPGQGKTLKKDFCAENIFGANFLSLSCTFLLPRFLAQNYSLTLVI